MTEKIEQTEIAKKLGMSNAKFRQMIEGKAEFVLTDGKRCYKMSDVLRVIKNGRL